LFIGVGSAETVSAQNAVRDLPADYVPGVTFTVSIALNPPGGTAVVGIEEKPPVGWAVSNIDHGGTFDVQTQKIKWGPFWALPPPSPPFPALLTYDLEPSGGASGEQCFTGKASFDGANQTTGGELCIPHSVPTLSTVGMAGLTLSLLLAGAIILWRTKQTVFPDR
jgi:hypothetical protein